MTENQIKEIQQMIIQHMNDNNFGKDWSRGTCHGDQLSFACYGEGNHIDATFSYHKTDSDGTVYGVIHPGGGAFKIGNLTENGQ
jgi:hypothetical protein